MQSSYKAGQHFIFIFSPPVAVATSTSREDDGLECGSGMQIPSLGFAIGKCKHTQEQDVTQVPVKGICDQSACEVDVEHVRFAPLLVEIQEKPLELRRNSKELSHIEPREVDKGCDDSAFGFYEMQRNGNC